MLLHEHSIDANGLFETRLDNKVTNSNVSIADCRVFWKDRKLNKGGIAVYFKEYFHEPSIKLKNNALDFLVLELVPKHIKLSICHAGIDPRHLVLIS